MPDFEYTQAQGMVESKPFQVKIRPNLGASKAIENISEGILQGFKFKAIANEQDYQANLLQVQTDLNNDLTTLNEIQDSDQRDAYVQQIESRYAGRFTSGTQYDNKINAVISDQLNSFKRSNFNFRLDNDYAQHLIDLRADQQTTAEAFDADLSLTGRQKLLQDAETKLEAMSQFKDPNSLKLYAEQQKFVGTLRTGVTATATKEADTKIAYQVEQLTSTEINAGNGHFNKEAFKTINERMQDFSNWPTNKGAYSKALGNQIAQGLINYWEGQQPTLENVQEMETALKEFKGLDPKFASQQSFENLQDAYMKFRGTYVSTTRGEIASALHNPTVSTTQLTEMVNSVPDYVLGKQGKSDTLYSKQALVNSQNKQHIATRALNKAFTEDTPEAWQAAVEAYLYTPGAAVDFARDIDITAASRETNSGDGYTYAFNSIKTLADHGISVDSKVLNDAAEGYVRNGIRNDEDIDNIMRLAEGSIKTGYTNTNLQKLVDMYPALKELKAMGIQDLPQRVQTMMLSDKKMPYKEYSEAVRGVLDRAEGWQNFTEENLSYLTKSFEPVMGYLYKAGYSINEFTDEDGLIESMLNRNFMKLDSGFTTVWKPKSKLFKSADQYNKVVKIFTDKEKRFNPDIKVTIRPTVPSDPEQPWVVLYNDGRQVQESDYFNPSDLAAMAATGKITTAASMRDKYFNTITSPFKMDSTDVDTDKQLMTVNSISSEYPLGEDQKSILTSMLSAGYSMPPSFKQEALDMGIVTANSGNTESVLARYFAFKNPKTRSETFQMLQNSNLSIKPKVKKKAEEKLMSLSAEDVKKFQEKAGIDVTGEKDNKTLVAFFNYSVAYGLGGMREDFPFMRK